jgi:conjugative relaxase-like TrwC/TraI family protein
VQTTHKIPGSSATTWSRYLVSRAARGDYYTHDGQGRESAPTQWHGPEKLLASYGIDPTRPVELGDLRSLMHGFSPVDGEPIRPVGSNGSRVAAVDLTFSAPKDVSALWATADPYRRAQIEVAHRRAVRSALEWTEREVSLVRRKTSGVVRFEQARRLLAVEAVHTTSRLGQDQDAHGIPDPQLHSHVAVIAAERQDGQVAAVESRQLFLAAREGGAWYRSELAANLAELGLPIQRRTGKDERYFGIRGISQELAERWSSRGQDVNRAARVFRQRYGREPRAGELDSLTLATRGSKSAAESIQVDAAWRALGSEHNQTTRRTEELFNDWGLHTPRADLRSELLVEVTRERSTITTRELRAKAYELSASVCRPADADRLIWDLAGAGELIQLQDGTWTTRELRETEQSTIDTAQRRAGENAAPVSAQSLGQALREIGKEIHGSLTGEQREALERITGPGGVAVLVGRAGTGKGVVISTAARAWQLQGNQVIGTAIAGVIAQRLQTDAQLDRAFTADGLINGVQQGHVKLDSRTVVVMDEAAMSDSDRLAKLTQLTARANAKILYVGDAAQISSIAAGGLFKELGGRVPTAELTEVHRAHHEWERKAWEQIRSGEPGPALASYQAHDRLHIHDTRSEAAEAMVDDWDQTRKRLPSGQAVMLTDASNAERDQINAMAQQRRAHAGELGSDQVTLPGKPYGLAAGDEIMFTGQYRIPRQNRVENGITGTILHAAKDEDRVTIKTASANHARSTSTPASSQTSPSPTPCTSIRPRGSPPRPRGSSPAAGRPTASTPTSRSAAPASRPRSTPRARTSASRDWTSERSNASPTGCNAAAHRRPASPSRSPNTMDQSPTQRKHRCGDARRTGAPTTTRSPTTTAQNSPLPSERGTTPPSTPPNPSARPSASRSTSTRPHRAISSSTRWTSGTCASRTPKPSTASQAPKARRPTSCSADGKPTENKASSQSPAAQNAPTFTSAHKTAANETSKPSWPTASNKSSGAATPTRQATPTKRTPRRTARSANPPPNPNWKARSAHTSSKPIQEERDRQQALEHERETDRDQTRDRDPGFGIE